MSARNLLIAIACFFLLVNIRSAFISKAIYGDHNAGYGSYGVSATKFMPDESGDPKVFFMGNSVYYGTDVIPQINKLEENGKVNFQTGNFGFTGASVYDYIHNYTHIRKFKPDLLVVQFNPTSFGYAGPYYRNDGYKTALTPKQLSLLSAGFLRSTYTKDDLAEVFCFSSLPIVRSAKSYRSWMNQKIKRLSRKLTKLRMWTFFPNKLNAVGEWATNRKKSKDLVASNDEEQSVFNPDSGPLNKQEYKTIEEALIFFINQLKADQQKAIFILQPSDFPRFPIMDRMQTMLAQEAWIQFVDNHRFFEKRLYIDKIHPNLEGAELAAQRHYALIKNQLN